MRKNCSVEKGVLLSEKSCVLAHGKVLIENLCSLEIFTPLELSKEKKEKKVKRKRGAARKFPILIEWSRKGRVL